MNSISSSHLVRWNNASNKVIENSLKTTMPNSIIGSHRNSSMINCKEKLSAAEIKGR
jgi:hypothetical protein